MKSLSTKETILQVNNAQKLYGVNRAEAMKMIRAGASKQDILKKQVLLLPS